MNFTLETHKGRCDCNPQLALPSKLTPYSLLPLYAIPLPSPVRPCTSLFSLIQPEMECLIRKMFCIALNFIFTFAKGVAKGIAEGGGVGRDLAATWGRGCNPVLYISLIYTRCTATKTMRAKKVYSSFCVLCFFCVLFNVLLLLCISFSQTD